MTIPRSLPHAYSTTRSHTAENILSGGGSVKGVLLRLRGGAIDNRRYYEILGLEQGESDENTIKKAYKKMALKWHPDRNPNNKAMADKKFKEVSEAYEVLSNKQSKEIYDKYGEQVLKQQMNGEAAEAAGAGGGMPGGVHFSFSGNGVPFSDPNDIFRQFFGGGSPFGSDFMSFGDEFNDPFEGSGMGGRSHGRFGHRRRQASPPEPVEQKFYCTLEELFRGCQKKFKILSSRIVTIDVKPGWKAGTKVSFNEQGQTIKFVLCEHPHKWFVRDGDDLRWKCKLTRQQAKKGVQLTIPMLDGTEVKWSTKGEQVYHGSCIAIASHGMPIKGGPARGNLIIEFALTD